MILLPSSTYSKRTKPSFLQMDYVNAPQPPSADAGKRSLMSALSKSHTPPPRQAAPKMEVCFIHTWAEREEAL